MNHGRSSTTADATHGFTRLVPPMSDGEPVCGGFSVRGAVRLTQVLKLPGAGQSLSARDRVGSGALSGVVRR